MIAVEQGARYAIDVKGKEGLIFAACGSGKVHYPQTMAKMARVEIGENWVGTLPPDGIEFELEGNSLSENDSVAVEKIQRIF